MKSAGFAKDQKGNLLYKKGKPVELFFDEKSEYWTIQKEIQEMESQERKERDKKGRKSGRRK